MSRTKARAPRTMLAPPVSMTAFADAGFTNMTLLGEMASTRFSARNRIFWSLRQASPASSTSPATASPVAR